MIGQSLLFKQQSDQNLYKLRSWEGLTDETKKLINLITLSDATRPVGSYKFKAHRYPSDIDIFERFRACCDQKTATQEIVKRLQNLVREVNQHSQVYWGDFKAGVDVRFYANPDSLTTAKQCRDHLKNISVYLSDPDYQRLKELTADPEQFNEELRKLYTLRWSPLEVIDGQKSLKNSDEMITLGQAINQNSVVKLDLWAPVDGVYNEITNYFIFEQDDGQGNVTTLNQELGNRQDSLLHDIHKYSSCDHYNPLKYAKRLWNWSILTNDRELSEELAPLFSSGVALLSQISGELEVVINLLKKYELKNIPVDLVSDQLEGYKFKLNNINDLDLDEQPLYLLLDQAVQELDEQQENNLISTLSTVISQLTQTINYYADQYLETVNLPDL